MEGLTKCYGDRTKGKLALDSVSFHVHDGETVGFVGLNGAGKTTTIRIASGATLPNSGTVTVDGHDIVNDKRGASENIGWVPEFPNFDDNAKAKSLLLYFAGFRHIPNDVAQKRASDLFHQLELSGQENKRLHDYSQGMKKRFSLALALLPERNLLLDEVLNGLDPQGIRFVRSLLADQKRQGKAVLISSHILSKIEAVSDKIVFIHKGKIIKIISRDDLRSMEGNNGVIRMTIPNLNEVGIKYLHTLGSVDIQGGSTVIFPALTDSSFVSTELIKRDPPSGAIFRKALSREILLQIDRRARGLR